MDGWMYIYIYIYSYIYVCMCSCIVVCTDVKNVENTLPRNIALKRFYIDHCYIKSRLNKFFDFNISKLFSGMNLLIYADIKFSLVDILRNI